MSNRWTWPAEIGLLFGLILFAILLLPLLLFQSRRYGRISAGRLVGAMALVIYIQSLLAYTLLPLPTGDLVSWCAAYGFTGVNLDPTVLVRDIAAVAPRDGVIGTLRSVQFLQGAFNVLLFVPWGVLVRRFFGWRLPAVAGSALVASVFIETTQYTGIFGLIPCSYRFADIDDVITNTLGGIAGGLVAPLVLRWMPQARVLAATRATPRPVTSWRRWLGMLGDAACFTGCAFVLEMLWLLGYAVATGHAAASRGAMLGLLGGPVPLIAVFVLPVATRSGATWGQRAVWLVAARNGEPGGRLPLARRAIRALPGLAWGGSQAAAHFSWPIGVSASIAVICVIAVPLLRTRGLSGLFAAARYVDSRGIAPIAREQRRTSVAR